MKISPFWYKAEIEVIYDRGVLFTAEDLKMTDDVIEEAFLEGVSNVTALSLGAGVPTEASFPHLVLDAFKDLLAISLETEYTFEEFNGAQLKEDIKSGKAAVSAGAADAGIDCLRRAAQDAEKAGNKRLLALALQEMHPEGQAHRTEWVGFRGKFITVSRSLPTFHLRLV